MPLLTTVIDDKSPLINYDATWQPGTSSDDPLASEYYLGTFTKNNVTGGTATLTFDFNGTAIWIYGAKRTNHGTYSVQIDGATFSDLNGNANDLFQQSLFNTSTLSQEMHTVKLTNTATSTTDPYVDIDMIAWQSEVGNTGDQLVIQVVQDTDSRFQYQSPAWVTTSSIGNIDLNMFNNGTGHLTQTYEATVSFTFTGKLSVTAPLRILTDLSAEAASLFGASGPSSGPYSVQVDGGQAVQYNASNAYPTNYGVMIYHADNLGSGSHQIVLTNLPDQSGQSLAIDYAQLWTTSNDTTLQTSTASSNNNLGSGAIAGIVVAAVIAVLSAGAAIFFYRRWRAALAGHHDLYRIYSLQPQPPESFTVPPTGFSSSLETRGRASLLQNDIPTQVFSGRTLQPANSNAAQYDGVVQSSSGIRDSQSVADMASSPTQSPVDDGSGRRPLPEAPGGGLSLAAEFPKFAGGRPGPSPMSTDRSSIAVSEAPPNYTQATGNAARPHE